MVTNGSPVPLRWERYSLIEDGQLQEHRVRAAAVQIARALCGGERGYSCNYGEHDGQGYDPEGQFAAVTERRQQTWRSKEGKLCRYSAC